MLKYKIFENVMHFKRLDPRNASVSTTVEIHYSSNMFGRVHQEKH